MTKTLLIVESPAKSKTLKQYLGSGFEILASYGHVRDLRPKRGAVDPENNFKMHYEILADSSKAINTIIKALKKVDALYLATDPDREGEAIAWHLYELLLERNALVDKEVHRIIFYEITKQAIQEAVQKPRALSTDLINAQQARRALDYLVGFNLSPLLWKKINPGLSAGRVQSPALKMIVEREAAIDAFKTREYWTIEAEVLHDKTIFTAILSEFGGEKIKKFSIENKQQATLLQQELQQSAEGHLRVSSIKRRQQKKRPAPPFTTSTLQQEAVRKLGFSSQKTMRIAQQLYEGVDIGHGTEGLITYMRTDSVNLSQEALQNLRAEIVNTYGKKNLPDNPRIFKVKSKNAQEAHEAIRPTSAAHVPQSIKSRLDLDQFKLYQLIWKRAMASQMQDAKIDTVAVDLSCGKAGIFHATGSVIAEPGFISVYLESEDEQPGQSVPKKLPNLVEGEQLGLQALHTKQHFTEPPPRYTEASLVKSLEEYGIGRPSTYVSIIQTLRHREYVEDDKKRFIPTDIGKLVTGFLTEHFTDYVNYQFTAQLEDALDAVSRGEKDWVLLLEDFWQDFSKQIEKKEATVSRGQAIQARILGEDPVSGREVSARIGRYGPYVQIGTKDDEEKPKFASLRNDQKLDKISLEEGLELFNLPRVLGDTEAGETVRANIGRFGPYIQYGNKFVSLPKEDDPYTVDFSRALELVAEKKRKDKEQEIKLFPEQGISILDGRYGPYVTDGKNNVKVPKGKIPAELSLADAQQILANPPKHRGISRKKKVRKK